MKYIKQRNIHGEEITVTEEDAKGILMFEWMNIEFWEASSFSIEKKSKKVRESRERLLLARRLLMLKKDDLPLNHERNLYNKKEIESLWYGPSVFLSSSE